MNTVMPSHPFVEIFSSQEVAAAAGVFLLAVIGLATMGVRWARAWGRDSDRSPALTGRRGRGPSQGS